MNAGGQTLFGFKNLVGAALALIITLPIAGCGDSGADTQATIDELGRYYGDNPSERGWAVTEIAAEGDKIIVDMQVEGESDLLLIRSSSRMKQFAIAKLGCPPLSVLNGLGQNAMVWVRLNAGKDEVLTLSICPHD